MSSEYSTLAPFYAGWDRYQTLLVDALADLTDEQLALRPSPDHWPVWLLAAHIITARISWFHRRMGEGDATLDAIIDWDDEGAPPRRASELVAGLQSTWMLIDGCLARWTPADLSATFYHERRQAHLTRQWIIWHVLEHDLNHGGELFLTLGIHGLPTPDL